MTNETKNNEEESLAINVYNGKVSYNFELRKIQMDNSIDYRKQSIEDVEIRAKEDINRLKDQLKSAIETRNRDIQRIKFEIKSMKTYNLADFKKEVIEAVEQQNKRVENDERWDKDKKETKAILPSFVDEAN